MVDTITSDILKDFLKTVDLELFDIRKIPKHMLCFNDKVRLQCYNCGNYNKKCTCPPNLPLIDLENLINKYNQRYAFIEKFNSAEDYKTAQTQVYSKLKLHEALLKAETFCFNKGYHFATSFIGGSCKMCDTCEGKVCRFPNLSRIPLEATGLDVMQLLKWLNLESVFPADKLVYKVGLLLVE